MGLRGRLLLAAWAMLCTGTCLGAPDFRGRPVSADARDAATWILASRDHRERPFAVVDKRAARIIVFDGVGTLLGDSPVLLGLTPGDAPATALGDRPVASLTAAERTTPSGRFASSPGRNDKGEAIVWFDYDAALAIHRLRPTGSASRRQARLDSAIPADHRASFGCVVVPVAFYESVVAPTLGRRAGVVYVLPEARPTRAFLDELQPTLRPD